jgi:hypothetical protein
MHIELLLEEPSAEAFFNGFLAKLLQKGTTWNPIVFQGKHDLLAKLEDRLTGYAKWIPKDWKIVVLIDEDREDCAKLKAIMEVAARKAKLATKSSLPGGSFMVLNRIAVEELESWFFGDPQALAAAFPGVSANIGSKAGYRDSDKIAGGTWEALERVLQRAGHYSAGLPKIEVAGIMAEHMEPQRNTSHSFKHFMSGLASL